MNDDFVNTTEAAEMLGVSRQRVSAMVRDGILPAVRPWPRAVRIARADIAAYLQGDGLPPIHLTAVRGFINNSGIVGVRRRKAAIREYIDERRPAWPEAERKAWADTMDRRMRGAG
jgi:excisionase family DNA binding protein